MIPRLGGGASRPVYLTPGLSKYTAGLNIDAPIDAFGRVRVSDPVTVFDAGHQYNVNPLVWETIVAGDGAVSHLPNESSASLTTGGTVADSKATIQTKVYHRYQPGKSQLVLCTGVFGAATANVRRRYGYFDADNGLFFEQTSAGMHVVVRSKASGSVVDSRINQTAWNLDKLDGTGASGITIDWTKAQIFLIDLEWLGVGRVRFGIVLGGAIVYVHEVTHVNALSGVYMTSANLPVRAEVENTDTTAAAATMKQICTSVISEGGQEDDRAFLFSAGNGITDIAVTTRRNVLIVRPKLLFNSLTNRGQVVPSEIALVSDENAYYEIVLNGTLGGSPSYTSANDASIAEYDVAGTTVTGGTVVATGFVTVAGNQATGVGNNGLLGRLPLVLNAAGTVADTLSVVVTSFSGTANVSASVTWREFR
jgi:hypothetical protein